MIRSVTIEDVHGGALTLTHDDAKQGDPIKFEHRPKLRAVGKGLTVDRRELMVGLNELGIVESSPAVRGAPS